MLNSSVDALVIENSSYKGNLADVPQPKSDWLKMRKAGIEEPILSFSNYKTCLLYTSDAADD